MAGTIPGRPWTASTSFAAGDLIRPDAGNDGAFYFVATGPGDSNSVEPSWCQTPYCDVDGGPGPGWRNTGLASAGGLASNAVWPGPLGQASQPGGYTDQLYLDYCNDLNTFLVAQGSAIPLDISSHAGPPFNGNWGYADSEAIAAALLGFGFGNEGYSINDQVTFQSGAIPSSHDDWIENFDVFSAAPIVRHLQMTWPGGNGIQAESFTLTNVAVANGTATASCVGDCSIYCSGTVYLTGNSNTALNDLVWLTSAGCSVGQVVFQVPAGVDGGVGGQVFAPDYLPATLPFAAAHATTALELHECTLDYAYGVTVGSANSSHPCAGLPGPDQSYQSAISAALQ